MQKKKKNCYKTNTHYQAGAQVQWTVTQLVERHLEARSLMMAPLAKNDPIWPDDRAVVHLIRLESGNFIRKMFAEVRNQVRITVFISYIPAGQQSECWLSLASRLQPQHFIDFSRSQRLKLATNEKTFEQPVKKIKINRKPSGMSYGWLQKIMMSFLIKRLLQNNQ